ncbi:chemotaxis protein CheA [Arcobacter sp. FWKO B]|uniref:chemotaxis protein CheA n=1 Tax=Arcobacter sp. FWKO B TaxID=2593672 RepID=UPI0018A529E2|nr:chemotaxis protein CheA [Arcobacter sp. FWKO B]QOG11381.1 chemotaxis protein CheA [Arcobacter sp. FWKO B]
MAGFDISMYREMFLEEAVELFESADNVLLEAENNGSLTDEQMGQLFRDVHTLKGSGASVELVYFAKFTHEVENMMDKLRNHVIEFIPEMASTLIDCMDVMKEILHLEAAGEMDQDKLDSMTHNLLAEIKGYLSGTHPSSAPSETVSVESTSTTQISDSFADKSEEDSIGFFDDSIDPTKFNKAYGFFKEEYQNPQAFGFYSDELQARSESAPTVATKNYEENDNFGFFDEMPAISPDNKELSYEKPEPNIEKPKSVTPAPIKKQAPVASKADAGPKDEDDKKSASLASATNNIRVNLDKIDTLMNNVGDLVITNAMLTQFATSISETKTRVAVLERLELLERHIREMQDSIMSIRMVPMESIYSKFPKVIRDISKKLNKKVEFKHYGDAVEIDKAMIEGLTDPLMHIIRNSLDHGIETPEDRLKVGKNETGTISISAEQANGQMIITIKDDGKGIDGNKVAAKALEKGLIDENQFAQMNENDKAMLVFGAGVSTADAITDISGRGVGMDVVKTNIHKLGGIIRLETELGFGTVITIVLPLTLAILDGLDIAVGDKKFILPLSAIVESLQPTKEMIKKIGDGTQDLLMLREEFIPVVKLYQLFNDVEPKYHNLEDGMLIVVKAGNQKVALFIDEFLHQHQVVVKPLDKNFRSVEGIGAATVRGDGSIGLILDILGIIDAQKKIDRHDLEFKKKKVS